MNNFCLFVILVISLFGFDDRVLEEEGLYCPCTENKGADQLRGYREADLRLCFRICKTLVFSGRGSSVGGQCNLNG